MANSDSPSGSHGSERHRPEPTRSACSNAGRGTPSTIWCRRLVKSTKCSEGQLWGGITNHRGPEDRHAASYSYLVTHTQKDQQPDRLRVCSSLSVFLLRVGRFAPKAD